MIPHIKQFILWFNYFVLGYYTLVNSIYMLLLIVAMVVILRHHWRLAYGTYQEKIHPLVAPPVSMLMSAYNEESGIADSTRALMDLDYPDYEVIVVNDGSLDTTLKRLIDAFGLKRINLVYRPLIRTAEIKGFYVNPDHPRLIVVDKAHSGKADSLNTALNISSAPYFCSVDADSILESDAIIRLMRPIIEEPEILKATGGIVKIANGSIIKNGRLLEVRLPKDSISRFQIVEYIRSFLFGRAGLGGLNSLLVISGTFSMFNKREIQRIGGYDTRSVTEDMELVIRLHKSLLERKKKYKINFVPDPICWTEAPRDLRMLRRQRGRWHRGLAGSLLKHASMLFRPRYRQVGFFALPYQLLVELMGPVVETVGYFVVVASYFLHIINYEFLVLFIVMALLVGIFFSTAGILLEDITYRRYPKVSELFILLIYGVLENFGYRQLQAFWRTRVVLSFIFLGRNKKWGHLKKHGFETKEGQNPQVKAG